MISEKLKDALMAYKSGDESAFSTVYEESKGYIYTCIKNTLNSDSKNEDMIQDIMQDTYLEVSKDIDKLENIDNFLSWAATIANRKCYATLKKNNKYVLLKEEENFSNLADNGNIIPEEIVLDKEKQQKVRAAINNDLTDTEKDCVIGYYYNDMKQSEIATKLNMPENTVKTNLFRAKSKMRQALQGVVVAALVACLAMLLINRDIIKEATGNKDNKVLETTKEGMIPEGCEYHSASTGKLYKAGDAFPETTQIGDVFITPCYKYEYILYTYNLVTRMGWDVKVHNNALEYYEAILSNINSCPVISMKETFKDCYSMKEAPLIPESIIDLKETFKNCISITKAPVVPKDIINMEFTFYNCTGLTGEMVINANPYSYNECFTKVNLTEQHIVLSGNSALLERMNNNTVEAMPLIAEGTIPAGCWYYIYSTDETRFEGEGFPSMVSKGDVYCCGDYKYTYGYVEGKEYLGLYMENLRWNVTANGIKETYEAIPENVLGVGVTHMIRTFAFNENLKSFPEIPDSVIEMVDTFLWCENVTGTLNVPESVKNMEGAFYGCTSLKEAPNVPSGVTDLAYTFHSCSNLTKAPEIPDGVTSLNMTFVGCESLIKAPEIPNSVTDMNFTFGNCKNLVEVTTISSNVTSLHATFKECKSLVSVPNLPRYVIYLNDTFSGCTSLVNAPEIPNGVVDISGAFSNCTSLITAPEIPESVLYIDNTFENCISLTGKVVINASLKYCPNSFTGVDFDKQDIELLGNCKFLKEIKTGKSTEDGIEDETDIPQYTEPKYIVENGQNIYIPTHIEDFFTYAKEGESESPGELVYRENGEYYGYQEHLWDGCSSWCGVTEFINIAKASSTLAPQGSISYDASNIYSENRNSVWCEGAEGDGIGEYIEITQQCTVGYDGADNPFTFKELCIVNGYAATEEKWADNNRVRELKVYFNDKYVGVVRLEDTIKPQYIDISDWNLGTANGEEVKFRFEITDIYKGEKYDDTCITGIVIEFDGRVGH